MTPKGSANSGKKRGGASSSSFVVLHADSTPDLVTDVNPHDILLGRGAPNAFHEGNVAFRRLIGPYKAIYMGTSRHNKKQAVAVDILNQVQQLGGRFLKEVRARRGRDVSKAWVEVSEEDALDKVKQALRERDALSDVPQDQQGEAAATAAVASMNDDHSDDTEDYTGDEQTGDEQEEDRKPAAVATVSHTPLPPPPPSGHESGIHLPSQPTTAPWLPYAHVALAATGGMVPFTVPAAMVTALGQQLPGSLATTAARAASLVGQSDTGNLGRSMTVNVLGQLDETRRRIQVLVNQQRITAVELHLLVQRQQQENVQLALLQQQEQRQQQSLTLALAVWGSGAAAAATVPPLLPMATATTVTTATTTAAAAPAANPSAEAGASRTQQQLAPGMTNNGNASNA